MSAPTPPRDELDELPPVIGERYRDVLDDIAQTEQEQ